MKHWWQREGYVDPSRHTWNARWHVQSIFPYRLGMWTVWNGEGDYDIAFITRNRRLADFAVFCGNLWHPLGQAVAWKR